MNKLLTTLALALSLSAPALAEKSFPVRTGVPCKLSLYKMAVTGRCSIATLGRATMYSFNNGAARYTVLREPNEKDGAVLYQNNGGAGIRIAAVQSFGDNCWMGHGVLLCAK
jgi:hypothetical protein